MFPKNCAYIQNTGQTISPLEDVFEICVQIMGFHGRLDQDHPSSVWGDSSRFARFLKLFQGNKAHSISAPRSGGIDFTISNRFS